MCNVHTKTAVRNALLLIIGSLLVPIRDVNSKLFQVKALSSGSSRVIVNMSANASDCPCKQGSGEGCHGQWPWQEARSVLYIHGSLGCAVSTLYTW